ncbi:unnamed protein product [Macrosiphum euphorbiae]|uniref:Ubiquitin-like protease family profile domain-containing protein n=1 Tax=Macrosiphum euphorbiae TaxID=13131 RepID=A0AAV0XXE2_9HEMI|nr:unnamed protein product [Macrosiphum euphorbiae]
MILVGRQVASQRVWLLNDHVLNDYFTLIKKENPSVHSFDTFFYERNSKTKYEGIKHWTKNVDIFSKRKVFFPINIVEGPFAHWIIVVADMVNQELVYYDSLNRHYNYKIHIAIMEYLGIEHEQKLGKSFPADDWKFVKGCTPFRITGRTARCLSALLPSIYLEKQRSTSLNSI